MIRAIFYSKFDVQKGPIVVHQVPSDSINTTSKPSPNSLIHWPTISSTIIPRQSFCSLPLSLLVHPYRVLSHPICLYNPDKYPRNEFIFSFSLVLHHKTPTPAYVSVVSKLADLFQHLEESSLYLSRDVSAPGTGRLHALCEILLEDLNNYCETMIPIDDNNTLNLKLFPSYPPPPPLKPHHVPLPTVKLHDLTDPNWDLTLLRILPFLDGVTSVRAIARKADADYALVKKAVDHLLYYGCVTLLDVFSFSNSYAPTAEIAAFVTDPGLQEECRCFVLGPAAAQSVSDDDDDDDDDDDENMRSSGVMGSRGDDDGRATDAGEGVSRPGSGTRPRTLGDAINCVKLVELYSSMRQGLPLRNWCLEHAEVMGVIDVRRLVVFGIIKGILYRVHRYAVSTIPSEKVPRGGKGLGNLGGAGGGAGERDRQLEDFLDGTHTFDEICTELVISERELVGKLKGMRDVQIIQK